MRNPLAGAYAKRHFRTKSKTLTAAIKSNASPPPASGGKTLTRSVCEPAGRRVAAKRRVGHHLTMWEIYDALIEGIAPGLRVDDSFIGEYWTMVRSGDCVGLSMTLHDSTRPTVLELPPDDPKCGGIELTELAAAAKSWNFIEASLGMAAVNAYWNSPERAVVAEAVRHGETEAFAAWKDRAAGKKVAVIGHFFNLEKTLSGVCELAILERRPGPGDYPDSACEYLLPQSDFVFATGVTFTNKTLPRLLELSQNAAFILAGPSVPMSPILFDRGVCDLHGLVISDPELCSDILRGRAGEVSLGEKPSMQLLRAGKRVSIARK